MSLTPRQRALRALSLKKPDRVPKWMPFTPPMLDRFKEKTRAEDPASYFEMEFREVAPDSTKKETDFRKYFASYPKNLDIDEWGVGYVKGSLYHFSCRSNKSGTAIRHGFDHSRRYTWEIVQRVGRIKE